MSKKIKKSKTKNLFRVDLNLKYLIYTDKQEYTENDVLNWIKNDFHYGEFDSDNALKIEKVESSKQIQDFLNYDYYYSVYRDAGDDDEKDLSDLVDLLGLDASVLVDKLKKLGYTVTPPKKR